MQIIQCGTKVITVSGSIKAIITGVCIRFDNCQYEISYFNNGQEMNSWVYRCEFEIDESVKKQAGFKNYNSDIKQISE